MGSLPAQKEAAMKNKCPYSHDGKCDIWIDYEVLRYAQDESNELLHANWSEIVYLLDRESVHWRNISHPSGVRFLQKNKLYKLYLFTSGKAFAFLEG